MRAPEILAEQEFIIQWARKLKEHHFNVSTIIQLLISNDTDSPIIDSSMVDTGIFTAREIYKQYNGGYKDNVLLAIQIDAYRKQNDIKEGQIVTDGQLVGFASNFNLQNRTFELFSNNRLTKESFIGTYSIDNYRKVS